MLTSLQDNAKKRIKEQEQFSAGGVATLCVRYSGFGVSHSDSAPSTSSAKDQEMKTQSEIEISLKATGKDLADAISQKSGKPSEL